MLSLGHEVYVYGAGEADVPCTEYIETHTEADIRAVWGDEGNNVGLGYDWQKVGGFRFDRDTDKRRAFYEKFLDTLIVEVGKRKRKGDFLCLTMGIYHKKVSDALQMPLTVETGIGYRNSFAPFRAFESSFIQNLTYGSENKESDGGKTGYGRFYDRVIPNYFDPAQFDPNQEKENYMLYIGRIIPAKGIHIGMEIAKYLGYKFILAGQGDLEVKKKYKDVIINEGYSDIEKRKSLMAKAKLFIYPTLYLEPFGGSTIEANLSATPVLTTNFGVFPETVENGINGYRCNTFQDFIDHTRSIMDGEFDTPLKRAIIYNKADKYTLDNVRYMYEDWFNDLYPMQEAVEYQMKTGKKLDVWYRLK